MSEQNQTPNIEEAIGDRASEEKTQTPSSPTTPIGQEKPATKKQIEANALKVPYSLEELQRQTEERLLNAETPEEALEVFQNPQSQLIPMEHQKSKTETPALKSDLQPVTTTSTQESPKETTETPPDDHKLHLQAAADFEKQQQEIEIRHKIADAAEAQGKTPVEDPNLTKLRNYIFDNGFTEAAVAMHITILCGQPLVTPATPTWAFHNNADIPSLVYATLKQPGYIEGIWPSLRVVMGSNIANEAWTSSIATTIAFFDVIRVLPVLQV